MSNKRKNDSNNMRLILIGGAIAAVVLVASIIFLQANTNASSIDYSSIPQSRTDDGGFVLGEPDAPVTVVAFEDFLCPHCQSYQSEVHDFIEEYVTTGQAKFEFRYVPTQPNSTIAATMAECAVEQGVSFWDAHDKLFNMASSRYFDSRSARDFAQDMGLNYTEALDCTEDANQYQTDQALGNQIGVQGTPTVGIRIGDGPVQLGVVSQAPTAEELGAFVESVQVQ